MLYTISCYDDELKGDAVQIEENSDEEAIAKAKELITARNYEIINKE